MISIIIPYFNKASTINRSVESVLNQTYANWELILIDDRSEVPLKEIFHIDDKRIQILVNEENFGPGPTRQKGLDIAKGEYVAFLDADDWWVSDFIEKNLKNLSHEPNAIASWCKALIYTDECEKGELRRYNELNHNNLIYSLLKYGHSIQTSAFLWRKNRCGKWGDLSTNQDSFFEFSSASKNPIVIKTDFVLLLRDETGNEHRLKYVNNERMYINSLKLYSSVFDMHIENFSIVHKGLLFHRFLNAYYKVLTNTKYDPFLEFKKRYPLLAYCLGRNKLLIKILIKLLRYTPLKFYY
jgi:glycosyltransferase involved in cell wall biosynthesis